MAHGRDVGVDFGTGIQRFATSVRFSLGFYAGRVFSLFTSSVVLIVLLAETTRLYVRLARTNAMLQHEQDNKLMNLEALASSIAHEMRQPLSAFMLNSEVALQLIKREPPDLAGASSALLSAIGDGKRTGEVLQSIRALFGKDTGEHELFDVNETAREALRPFAKSSTIMASQHAWHLPPNYPSLPAAVIN